MDVKKIIRLSHRWLGLISGLVVFIVAITGCIYAFQSELQDLLQSYRFVEPREEAFLPPSKIQGITDKELPGKHIHAVLYQGNDRAAQAIYWAEDAYYDLVYINPYDGQVLEVRNELKGFFHFILEGHFYLWLPHEIGQPLIASATLVFLAMLISGIILWWPRNKSNRKQRFSIKWSARWRRKNYDLHSVFGFYVSWLALIFALTGLVWGFEWFRDLSYSTASGGDQFIEYADPGSKIGPEYTGAIPAIDMVWKKMQAEYPGAAWIEVHPPAGPEYSIAANANPDAGTYWKTDYRYFDQHTLKEVSVEHVWGRLEEASGADKLMRMNYDIHTGGIFGFSGKVLAFLISLVIASLPVTGIIMWIGRQRKKSSITEILDTPSMVSAETAMQFSSRRSWKKERGGTRRGVSKREQHV